MSGEAQAASLVKKNITFLLNMVAYTCMLNYPCHLRHVNKNNQLKNDTTVSVGAEGSRTINQEENNAEAVEKKGRL